MKYRPCGYLKIIVILQPFKYYYLCDGNITQMCLLIKSRIEMRKNLFYYLFTVLCTATLFISCSDDEDTPNPVNPLVGVNQTIMMSLSMVVIAAMIAAGGLGEIVLKGITQMKIGLGFEGGIAVVILAIILDRITQGMAGRKNKN